MFTIRTTLTTSITAFAVIALALVASAFYSPALAQFLPCTQICQQFDADSVSVGKAPGTPYSTIRVPVEFRFKEPVYGFHLEVKLPKGSVDFANFYYDYWPYCGSWSWPASYYRDGNLQVSLLVGDTVAMCGLFKGYIVVGIAADPQDSIIPIEVAAATFERTGYQLDSVSGFGSGSIKVYPSVAYGDLNGDSTVQLNDAHMSLDAANGRLALTFAQHLANNVLGDNAERSENAYQILQRTVNAGYCFSVERSCGWSMGSPGVGTAAVNIEARPNSTSLILAQPGVHFADIQVSNIPAGVSWQLGPALSAADIASVNPTQENGFTISLASIKPIATDAPLIVFSGNAKALVVHGEAQHLPVEGVVTVVTGVGAEPGVPASFALQQNYPNPFNPTTMISYTLPQAAQVRLSVYNVLGETVADLVDSWQGSGTYQAPFNAPGLPSGVYHYRLVAGTFTETKKMLLMK